MNENNNNNSLMCNQNLPLKKRRNYFTDSPSTTNNEQDENYSKTIKQSNSQDNSAQMHILTPPSSPHIELLRQQYAYLLTNPTNIQQQTYLHPSTYDCLIAQNILTQQFFENYRTSIEQQQQQCSYTIIEDEQNQTNIAIDEHFRKSLGNNYNKLSDRCLTPDDSSSNSSSIERTPVDSIEEHFARSLAKFWPGNPTSSINHQIIESVVDDHFAKALGSTTWEKLKEKS